MDGVMRSPLPLIHHVEISRHLSWYYLHIAVFACLISIYQYLTRPPVDQPRESRSTFSDSYPLVPEVRTFLHPWATGVYIEWCIENKHPLIELDFSVTNSDGRCLNLLPPEGSQEAKDLLTTGIYKVVFKTKEYFDVTNRKCFYPWVEVG
jgi:hypothetical protein